MIEKSKIVIVDDHPIMRMGLTAMISETDDLEVIGGFGLRFQMEDRVFMRIDVAGSREGFRLIWTFNNVF